MDLSLAHIVPTGALLVIVQRIAFVDMSVKCTEKTGMEVVFSVIAKDSNNEVKTKNNCDDCPEHSSRGAQPIQGDLRQKGALHESGY